MQSIDNGRIVHGWSRQLAVGLAVLLTFLLSMPAMAGALRALPAVAPVGAEISVSGRGLDSQDYRLLLRQAGALFVLDEGIVVDASGRFEIAVELPDVPPGDWEIRLDNFVDLVAATPIRILANPSIDAVQVQAFPGETIDIQASDLTPDGSVEILADGLRLVGPLPVSTPSAELQVDMPASTATTIETVNLELRQRFAGVDAGQASDTVRRLVRQQSEFENLVFTDQPPQYLLYEQYELSGRIDVPDGINAGDLDWQYALIAEGACLPPGVSSVEMEPSGDFQVSVSFDGLTSGIVAIPDTFDQHGLAYVNPDTGEQGCISGGSVDLRFEGAVPLEVLVLDPSGNPIDEARVLLRQATDENPFLSTGGGEQLNLYSGHLAGTNQFGLAFQQIQQTPIRSQPSRDVVAGSCPYFAKTAETSTPGLARFEISFLGFYAASFGDKITQVDGSGHTRAPKPAPLEFTVVVGALEQGYGFLNDRGCGTGMRFDISATGNGFNLRDPNTGEFTVFYDPFSGPLEVTLPELPSGSDLCFLSDAYIPGVPLETKLGESAVVNGVLTYPNAISKISSITTYPQASVGAGYFREIEPTEIELDYDPVLYGVIDNVVLNLEGQPTIPLSFGVQGGCAFESGIITGEIPNMHRFAAGTYAGSITAQIQNTGQTLREDFELVVEAGRTWFTDSTQYEDVVVDWAPDLINVYADEIMQMQSATPTDRETIETLNDYDVTLDNNDQAAAASVRETIRAGFRERIRTSITEGEVNGRSGNQSPVESNITQDGPANGSTRLARSLANLGRDTSCDHPNDNGDPDRPTPFPRPDAITDFGSCEPETIFETGAIPIFRYAWGIPPIAAATLGADIWFGVYFRYFGDVALAMQRVSVNFTAEPVVRAGLDIFFDLSALFGIVTARVQATPTIGIGMPISVIDSEFAGIEPCFNFDLILYYIASLGWCDLCVEARGDATLFTLAEPSGCSVILPDRTTRAPQTSTAQARPSVTVNPILGTGWIAYETRDGIIVDHRQNEFLLKRFELDSQPGAMRPQITWLGDELAVVVWSQTDLTEQEFEAIAGGVDFSQGTSELHLVYAIYDPDTDTFGPTQDLTAPGMGGDGGVELAVCPPDLPQCGGGKILAAWEHDRAGDLSMHDLEVRWAEFSLSTSSWTLAAAIDPGNTFKQVQPNVLYHQGRAMVFWIENPAADASAYDMNQRHLRYRLPDLAGAQDATGIPPSIASPDAVSDGNEVIVAYTVSADATRFIGSRRALHSATGTCISGICSWTDQARTDSDGRSLYVEQPQVVRKDDGTITAHFRYLSNSNVREDDPLGVKLGTGDLARLELRTPVTNPTPVTLDGQVNIGLETVVNPVSGDVFNVFAKGPQLAFELQQSLSGDDQPSLRNVVQIEGNSASRGVNPTADVFFGTDPGAPDFVVLEATTTASQIAAGETIEVSIRLMNRGGEASAPQIEVVATWNRPFGPELPVASTLADLSMAGSIDEVTLMVPTPDNAAVDQKRKLYITVDPGGLQGDGNGNNNSKLLTIGGLPVPENLSTLTSRDTSLVQIEWRPVEDDRVVGYSVYRRNPDGRVLLLGTSETNGFLDLRAVPNRIYEYQIRSHSANFAESEPTPWRAHLLEGVLAPDQIFRDAFQWLFAPEST